MKFPVLIVEPTHEEFAQMFEQAREREREESKVSVDSQGDIRYSVWVSYAELYNEVIYDLLESVPKKKNSRRPTLSLRQDQNANPYIKGNCWFTVNFKCVLLLCVNI